MMFQIPLAAEQSSERYFIFFFFFDTKEICIQLKPKSTFGMINTLHLHSLSHITVTKSLAVKLYKSQTDI